MQTRASLDEDDEFDDIAPGFLNAVTNARGRLPAPTPMLASLGQGRRPSPVIDSSLAFHEPKVRPPTAREATLLEAPSDPMSPPPTPPPSLEDEFLPPLSRPMLPHTLHFHVDALPLDLASVPLPQLYELLGDMLAARDCALNHATFWVLDSLLEALLTAQRAQLLTARGQCAFVEWFGFLLTALTEHAWTRAQLFAHLESAMVASVRTSASDDWRIPCPERPATTEEDAVATTVVAAEPTPMDAVDVANFDPVAAVAELATIARLLYATFGDGFAHAVQHRAFCEPQIPTTCPLERMLLFPKTLRPPPKKEKKPQSEGKPKKPKKPEKGGKGGKSTKGGKVDKSGKSSKSDKSEKGGKSDKSEKGSKSDKSKKGGKKGSQKGKSDKGDGDIGGKGKKGAKKDKQQVEEVEEVQLPPPENPLSKYRVEEVDWARLAETALLNKECVCRLVEACPEKFFTDLYPPKPKKETKDKLGKKGKKKGGNDKGGKGKEKGGKGKGKKK